MRSCSLTAVLDSDRSEQRVSTGIDAVDAVLGGLYWGDNVVWQLDRAPLQPFYGAIAGLSDTFDTRTFISLGNAVGAFDPRRLAVVEAGPGSDLAQPADLLREIHRICHPRGRTRRQRSRARAGRGTDAGSPLRRGAGHRQRTSREMAQPRPSRGRPVLDRRPSTKQGGSPHLGLTGAWPEPQTSCGLEDAWPTGVISHAAAYS